jgi:hypothetical protein
LSACRYLGYATERTGHLPHAFATRSVVAKVAQLETIDAPVDCDARFDVPDRTSSFDVRERLIS